MPQWIKDGHNGYIAEAVTANGIDAVLERAWNDKEEWRNRGLEAHKVFKEKYPQPYEKYYSDLLQADEERRRKAGHGRRIRRIEAVLGLEPELGESE